MLFHKPSFLSVISGKSFLIKYICYQYRKLFNYIVVVAPMSDVNTDYNFLPKSYVHNKYDDSLVDKIIAKQTAYKKAGKNIHMLLVLDDVAATPNMNFKKQNFNSLNKLWSANRHLNISVCVICHQVKQAPPLLRGNADYSVISKVLSSALDDLWEEYGTFENKNDFYKIYSTRN